MLRINGLRYRTNTCTPFPGLLRLLPFLDPSVIDPLAGAQLKRYEFLPDRINSDFILQIRTVHYIPFPPAISVPLARCLLAGVWSLLDEVSAT